MPASGRMRLSRRASFVYQGQRQLHLVPSPELAFELHDFRRARSPARQNQNLAWLDTHNFIHGGRGKRRLDVTYLIRVWGDMDLNRLGGTKAAGDRDQREHGGPANESHRSTRYFWGVSAEVSCPINLATALTDRSWPEPDIRRLPSIQASTGTWKSINAPGCCGSKRPS